MAIIHKASVAPTKLEIVTGWLDRQPWIDNGPVELIGSYRFDDPNGQVGVESILVRRGDAHLQVPLTYRPGQLDDAADHLISTMDHSVLGRRWIYEASSDPVAVSCYVRALQGVQEQADMEIWEGDRLVERRESVVRLVRGPGGGVCLDVTPPAVAEIAVPDGRLLIPRILGSAVFGQQVLTALWPHGRAVVAALLEPV